MNKNLVAIAVVIVILIAGGFIFLSAQSNDETSLDSAQPSPSSSQNQDTDALQEETASSENIDNYTEYSEVALARADGTKLLFFHASWCPQCRALEEDILASGVPEGVTIFKVDYDSSQELKEKYGVTQQTTVVKVDDDGNLVDKIVPYDDPSLSNVKNSLL